MSEEKKDQKSFLQPHSVRKQEQVRKLATLGDDPEWWHDQIEMIKDGKSLEELAVLLQVNFSVYRHWIMGDTKREKDYAEAFSERKRRMLERVEERLFKTALNPTGYASFSDSNRAAEILRNSPTLAGASQGFPVNLNIVFVGAQDGKPALEKGTTIDQVP